MAFLKVTAYAVHWNLDNHGGNIQLNLADNSAWAKSTQTPEEMSMLVDLSRNEKPIYYDTVQGTLHLGIEPVGEGE